MFYLCRGPFPYDHCFVSFAGGGMGGHISLLTLCYVEFGKCIFLFTDWFSSYVLCNPVCTIRIGFRDSEFDTI